MPPVQGLKARILPTADGEFLRSRGGRCNDGGLPNGAIILALVAHGQQGVLPTLNGVHRLTANQRVEFSLVKPDAAAFGAVVDLDTLTLNRLERAGA
jgi:hypothetical protein